MADSGAMGILASIGQALIPSSVQTDLQAAETQLTIGLSVMVGLEFVIAAELLVIMVLLWKEHH